MIDCECTPTQGCDLCAKCLGCGRGDGTTYLRDKNASCCDDCFDDDDDPTDKIVVRTNIHSPTPNRDGIDGGLDYTAELTVTDTAGVLHAWTGNITLAPAQYDGEMRPYGNTLDYWASGNLCKALETPWIAADKKLVALIIRDLAVIGDGESKYYP